MNETKTSNLRVERGTESRLDLLRPLWLCLHHHHQSIAPNLAPYIDDDFSWETRRCFYADCLSHEGSFVLLAYSGKDLIGYALVLVQKTSSMWSDTWVVGDRTAELETIVVSPEWRGKGVDGLLMDHAEAELERQGIKDIIIGLLPTNTEVLHMYNGGDLNPPG